MVLAQERKRNAVERGVLAALCAVLAWALTQGWPVAAWLALNSVVTALSWRSNAHFLQAAATPGAPLHLRARTVACFAQAAVTNGLALILWREAGEYGPYLGAVYLIGGTVNGLVTLRGYTPFLIASLIAAVGTYVAGCLTLAFVGFGGVRLVHLTPLAALPIVAAFGVVIYRHLRKGDDAEARAVQAAEQARTAAEEARAARAIASAALTSALAAPIAAARGLIKHWPPDDRHADRLAALAACIDVGEAALAADGEPAVVDAEQMVRAIAGAHAPLARAKGVELFVDVAPDAGARRRIDAAIVRKIAFHLVANALHVTRHGGVRVRLQVEPQARGGARMAISVADAGPGLARDRLARIMAGGDGGQTPAEQRLALCVAWAGAAGFMLRARSDEGRGSVFTLIFPARAVGEAAPSANAA
jgi:signal transduction histidine kinase